MLFLIKGAYLEPTCQWHVLIRSAPEGPLKGPTRARWHGPEACQQGPTNLGVTHQEAGIVTGTKADVHEWFLVENRTGGP